MKKRKARKARKGPSVDKEMKTLMRISSENEKAVARKRPKEEPPLNLVTGGCGRLGRYLVKALAERGERVRVLQHSKGSWEGCPKGVEIASGDLLDKASLEKAAEDVDYVYHLAALVNPEARFEELLDVNYRGTRNLLEACRDKSYHLKRFIFISSISVYGKEPAEIPADEETGLNPTDNYGKSKMMAEEAVGQYGDKIPYVILRPAVIYGEGFDEAYLSVLSALKKGRMSILGDGNNNIPFIHATDVVQAMLLASRAERAVGNTYVIAPEDNMTQKQVFALACKHLGTSPPIGHSWLWLVKLRLKFARLFGKPKITEDYIDILTSNRRFNIDRAKEDIGFKPKVKLDDGIQEMVEYYRSKGGK